MNCQQNWAPPYPIQALAISALSSSVTKLCFVLQHQAPENNVINSKSAQASVISLEGGEFFIQNPEVLLPGNSHLLPIIKVGNLLTYI